MHLLHFFRFLKIFSHFLRNKFVCIYFDTGSYVGTGSKWQFYSQFYLTSRLAYENQSYATSVTRCLRAISMEFIAAKLRLLEMHSILINHFIVCLQVHFHSSAFHFHTSKS